MKAKNIRRMLAVCAGVSLLAGCGGEKQNTYKKAEESLEAGNYQEALSAYESSVSADYKTPQSLRGAGIASLRLGAYQEAADYFTRALEHDKTGKSMEQDLLAYRATAKLKAGLLDDAMADCQILASDYSMTADTYFLTGSVALAMDAYDEAGNNFKRAYGENTSYGMAIQIYEVYAEHDMEADGTHYLEAILETSPNGAEDLCQRGRIYYYMEDYDNAKKELTRASERGSAEANLLLGMVCLAQGDTAAARSMYQDYLNEEGAGKAPGYNGMALCDIEDGDYDSALSNIAAGLETADVDEMQELLFNEIVTYEKKLDFTTALSKARSYMEMYPDDETIAREVTFLESRTGALSSPEPETTDSGEEEQSGETEQ